MTKYQYLNAEDMKTALMMKYRFEKGAIMVATEAGSFNSDVLIYDAERKLIEIEVKVSLTDFKSDFRKPKHQIYEEARRVSFHDKYNFQPHYFFFAVPEDLLPSIMPLLIGKPYGVIAFRDVPYSLHSLNSFREVKLMRMVRKPKRMRYAPVTSDEIFMLQKRIASDLIRTRIRARGKKYVESY